VGRLALVALAACGRVGFDAVDGASVKATGPKGPRHLAIFSPTAQNILVAGANGGVFASVDFQGSVSLDGTQLTGQAPSNTEGVFRLDASGAVEDALALDSTESCDMRDITMDGPNALFAGIANGPMTAPNLGACAVATTKQDPIAIEVQPGGSQVALTLLAASGRNGQLWHAIPYGDGSLAMTGLYGADLSIGGTALPTVAADSVFLARYLPGASSAMWTTTITSPITPVPGPLAVEGQHACAIGLVDGGGTSSVFGTQLTLHAGIDAWIARVGPTGAAEYVRPIATDGDDTIQLVDSLIALGGHCIAAVALGGPLTIDGIPLDGPINYVLDFDTAGKLVGAVRIPAAIQIATAGGRIYAALSLNTQIKVAGQDVNPQGVDAVVVQLGANEPTRVVAIVGGAGDQIVQSFAAIADDAVAVGVQSTGQVEFGGTTFDSGGAPVQMVATIGVTP
jgi:hypothetical protein